MKKFLLFFLFILLLSCDKDSNYIESLKLIKFDKPIKVTNIQPGMTETNFSNVRFHGDEKKAADVYAGIKPLTACDIADIVIYVTSAPEHVQICEVTVTPTNQATGGVVFKINA